MRQGRPGRCASAGGWCGCAAALVQRLRCAGEVGACCAVLWKRSSSRAGWGWGRTTHTLNMFEGMSPSKRRASMSPARKVKHSVFSGSILCSTCRRQRAVAVAGAQAADARADGHLGAPNMHGSNGGGFVSASRVRPDPQWNPTHHAHAWLRRGRCVAGARTAGSSTHRAWSAVPRPACAQALGSVTRECHGSWLV